MTKTLTQYSSVIVLALLIGALQLVNAFTAPLQPAPNGNVAGPITTGEDQSKTGGLSLGGSLSVGGNVGLAGVSSYLNFNTTVGALETGYGFRDNAGTMEYKNNGGAWTAFGGGNSVVIPSCAAGQVLTGNGVNLVCVEDNTDGSSAPPPPPPPTSPCGLITCEGESLGGQFICHDVLHGRPRVSCNGVDLYNNGGCPTPYTHAVIDTFSIQSGEDLEPHTVYQCVI